MTLTEEAAPAQPRPASTPRSARLWWIAAGMSVLGAAAVHLSVARGPFAKGMPTFSYDEIDTLMAGRAALGVTSPDITGAGYFPLSSILVSPVWWLTSNPFVFYRVGIAIGVLIALVTIWPLARIASRFGLTTPQAVTVAALVMALPARSVQAGYLLAEKPLFLLLTVSVLAAMRLSERPTALRAMTFGALVALTYFTHARMLVFVAAATVWLMLFALRRWQAALVGLVTLLPLAWAAGRLARHINGLVNPAGFVQGDDLLGNLSLGHASMMLRTGLGQAWEQLLSGFGLAVVGLVVATAMAVRELRHRSPGPAILVILTALALFGGSTLAWATSDQLYATTWRRLDAWLYGRYADPAFELLTLFALCAIVRGLSRTTVLASWCLALAIAVPTLLWVAPMAPTGSFITPAHLPGAMPWEWALPAHVVTPGVVPSLTNDNRFWLIATVTALVPLVVLALVRGWRGAGLVMAAVVLLLATVGSLFAGRASGHYQATHEVTSPLAVELRSILAKHPGATVGYEASCPKPLAQQGGKRNRFAWQLLPTIVSTRTTDVDIAIACQEASGSIPPGSLELRQTAYGRVHAWVVPGPLQDQLVAAGTVTPSTATAPAS
ncbi:hypothetical protein JCM18899A_53220 [Nocardioides sp. AN3]